MKARIFAVVLGLSLLLQPSAYALAAENTVPVQPPDSITTDNNGTDNNDMEEGEPEGALSEDVSLTVSSNVALLTDEAALKIADIEACRKDLKQLLSEKTVSALVYLCDEYSVREEPSAKSGSAAVAASGQQVFFKDFALADNEIWYLVSFYIDEQEYEGYIQQTYLAYSDEDFLAWENTYMEPFIGTVFYGSGHADVAQFPSSYQGALNSLKAAHPNWTFVKFNTNLDWNTVIENEDVMVSGQPRNAVPANSPSNWISGSWTGSWSRASTDIIKYYMDPRNFLNDPYIFQFEQLTYNSSYHTQSAVQNILNDSFMAGGIPGDGRSYSQAFYEIGSNLGVSPFHLACRVYQEQGKNGTSALISGTYPGYENLYNYFNIGATGSSTSSIITNGLTRARKEGWTNRYASLLGGAQAISKNYILKGQDTLYLQKFDVDGSYSGLYYHQYMQNLMAPYSESSLVRKAYSDAGAINNNFVFKIPVYNSMPGSACGKPGETPPPAACPFVDIESGKWYYEGVLNAYNRGWMAGTDSTHFEPFSPLTRSMFSAVLYRLNGSPSVAYAPYFPDIPDGKWYSSAAVWAYNTHIVSGYTDGCFHPDDHITREQMAKMLHSYASLRGFDTAARADLNGFSDRSSVSGWAAEEIKWAVAHGFISGKINSDGSLYLDPKGNATRAECASILSRFFNAFGE